MLSFCFKKPAVCFKIFFLLIELVLDFTEYLFHPILGSEVQIRRKNGGMFQSLYTFPGFDFDSFDLIDFISEKTDPVSIVYIRKIDVDRIPPHSKCGAVKMILCKCIEACDQIIE